MPNVPDDTAVPARLSRLRSLSPLWLVPAITLLVGLVMVYQNYIGQGPQVTIRFNTAAGLEAGRTLIKTLEAAVGRVEDITLAEDMNSVLVTARIHNEFRDLLTEDARFWVVQPTVSLAGISGLNTLITGQYIRFAPGTATRTSDRFTGLEQAPLTPPGSPGLHLTLVTDGDFSFGRGEQIHYQGLTVGKIEDVRYDLAGGRIYYDAFIEAPFHELITTETRFWKASGVQAELTSDGFRLESGSLDTLLVGGVSFTTPPGSLRDDAPSVQTEYYVFPNRNAIDAPQYQEALRYWVMVRDSVGGLGRDSRVVYRGVQVGRVLSTDYIPPGRNLLDRTLDLPVLIEINPGRLGLPDNTEGVERATQDIDTWIREGLVATIKAQNFLLGQQQVELEYHPGGQPVEVATFNELTVIPTDVDSIGRFTSSIEALLTKLNELPIEQTLDGVTQLSHDASATLTSMQALLESTQSLLSSDRNTALLQQLDATLASLQTLANSFSAESRTTQEAQRTLQAITDFMNEFRPLATELRNQPNSLIFPRNAPPELQPMRKQP